MRCCWEGGAGTCCPSLPLPQVWSGPPPPTMLRLQVHCVRAYGAVHDALRRLALTVPVVLHSWTGAAEMTAVLAALRTPVYFSLSGHLLKQPPAKALPMVHRGRGQRRGGLGGRRRRARGRRRRRRRACRQQPRLPCLPPSHSLLPLPITLCHPLRPPTTTPCAMQVRAIPLDRLMIESDSPDGALDPPPAWLHALPQLSHLPGELRAAGLAQLNRPCVLRWTLQLVAAAAGRPEEEVACATWDNACRVFGCTPDGVGAAAKQLDSQG